MHLENSPTLKLLGTIGFNGSVSNAYILHPDKINAIYSIGSTVVFEKLLDNSQVFLHAHDSTVTCLSLSKCGAYVASGQKTFMGYKADIILWSYENQSKLATFSQHKVCVKSLVFSPKSKFLVSIGGSDDSCVAAWSIEKLGLICGKEARPKKSGLVQCIAYSKRTDEIFVTAGDNTCRIWRLDDLNRKLQFTECAFGKYKRNILCIEMQDDDSQFYCGTTTGDILIIGTQKAILKSIQLKDQWISLGITALKFIQDKLIVGGGDGSIQLVNIDSTGLIRKDSNKLLKLNGRIINITSKINNDNKSVVISTDENYIYNLDLDEFKSELVSSCHGNTVNDIKFPENCSEIFVSCSHQEIRVFHARSKCELLQIKIQNMTCLSLDLLKNGTAILSGWSDSKIRAFYPETGRLMFNINDAHKNGVTAIVSTSTCDKIITGGGEGQVRVWKVTEVKFKGNIGSRNKRIITSNFVTSLIATMKEHANSVSCIKVNKSDTSCVSSSSDGTCIIWCLENFRRKQIIFSNTLFKMVCYHPNEYQIITTGTNRKISYWELYDESLVRELDASNMGSINGLDITKDGSAFVSGGDDKVIQLWNYNEGILTHVGKGHSSSIKCVRISPMEKRIVSGGEDGSIYIWEFPQ